MTRQAALAVNDLEKSFGGVRAVRGISLQFDRGRVHALLGENGAGKSTTVNMLSGALKPDSGSILLNGEEVNVTSPAVAQSLGIRTVHQELELADNLSAYENIFMGRLVKRRGLMDRKSMIAESQKLLRELGSSVDARTRVAGLSVADRQVVEIARALAAKPNVLILDEPTAALSPHEIERLLAATRALAAAGVAVVYISHRLDEVLQVSDDITVLRDGEVAARLTTANTTRDVIVSAMLGRELQALESPEVTESGEAAVRVTGLTVSTAIRGARFQAGRGEIVGFFGLAGAGHDQIANALFGRVPATADTVEIGDLRKLPRDPAHAIRSGIGYVTADRKGDGLALRLSVSENLLMTFRRKISRSFLRNRPREQAVVKDLIARYQIKAPNPHAMVSSLSGGNQQKIMLARWGMSDSLRVLLLCEPTRGVDVGAKAEIYRLLMRFASAGGTAMIFSSDPEEIVAVCDRAYVVRQGQLSKPLVTGSFDVDQLTELAM